MKPKHAHSILESFEHFCQLSSKSIWIKPFLKVGGFFETQYIYLFHFYRATHFSAKRGIAIACRLSVCLSVCL